MMIDARTTNGRLNNRGLTLIEVVAALGIIAVGIVGILALFPTGLKQHAEATNRTTAAVLGEYVVEQVRLQQGQIEAGFDTQQALNAIGWDNYTYDGMRYTFNANADGDDTPSTIAAGTDAYGSGEQIMWQRANPNNPYDPDHPEDPNNGLSDTELYSHYEVTLEFGEVRDGPSSYNSAFTSPGGSEKYLMQVTVTVRWPRATTDSERVRQNTLTYVTFIRPDVP